MELGIKGYLSLIGLGTCLSGLSFFLIVLNVDPDEAGFFGLAMFYVTLAVTLIGVLTILMTLIRIFGFRREVVSREIRKAFRHAVLFSIVTITSLALAAADRLTTLTLLALIAITAIIEYFFLQIYRGKG